VIGEAAVRPVGDRAFLIGFAPTIDPELSAELRSLAAEAAARPDVAETVPGFCTLLVILRPEADRSAFIRDIPKLLAEPSSTAPPPSRIVEVPVKYGGRWGVDLGEVASRTGLSEAEVLGRHTRRDYLVYMLGFAPGFPYLGILDDRLRLARRASPRIRVPAGTVAIADRLTGVYPQDTPGGWHMIGWTSLRIFDPAAAVPFLLGPGDRVRFVDITSEPVPDDQPEPAIDQGGPSPPSHPVFAVREGGLVATVQDGGRFGYRRFGVPWSGPMDPVSHAAANTLVGNDPRAAAIELTLPAPVLESLEVVVCAVVGPGWRAVVDGHVCEDGIAFKIQRGQTLTVQRSGNAMWAYLAITGGINVPAVLGSRSTYIRGRFGGLSGRGLRAGDLLGVHERGEVRFPGRSEEIIAGRRRQPGTRETDGATVIRIIPGPQEGFFTPEGFNMLISSAYAVTTRIDRTGYRLEGPRITHVGPAEILPEGVVPGAIQVPPDGQPIVLMADGPTTGGYPKIGTVVSADLPRLAQCAPGSRVRFRAVTVAELAHADPIR
jgi:KipI family sensor histidine kinase inhibitor